MSAAPRDRTICTRTKNHAQTRPHVFDWSTSWLLNCCTSAATQKREVVTASGSGKPASCAPGRAPAAERIPNAEVCESMRFFVVVVFQKFCSASKSQCENCSQGQSPLNTKFKRLLLELRVIITAVVASVVVVLLPLPTPLSPYDPLGIFFVFLSFCLVLLVVVFLVFSKNNKTV